MTRPRRRRWWWLVAAVVLLTLGAWLMRGAEAPERAETPAVRLPLEMTRVEAKRAEVRKTWVPEIPFDAAAVRQPPRPSDPVLELMPSQVKYGAMVAEFNAILQSELGGLLTQCLFGDGPVLQNLRDAGFDPTKAIDRVAMIDDSLVVTGDFQNGGWKRLVPKNAVAKGYGERGELIEVPFMDGGVGRFATWGGQMFLAGDDEASLKRSLDRLDGRGAPQGPSVIDESMAYGEVYGVLAPSALSLMLGETNPGLAGLIDKAAKSVQVHMDISHDVGLVADVEPNDAQTSDELRRALGSALSLSRVQAQANGRQDEAAILDLARVRASRDGRFRLEAGLPYDFMKKALDKCIDDRRTRQRTKLDPE
jgi:hypothetical protein